MDQMKELRFMQNSKKNEGHLYSVGEICSFLNVTRKTLFYYDKNGLLEPTKREGTQGFKFYDIEQVHRLEQILSYRNAGLSISEIRQLLDDKTADRLEIMKTALNRLQAEKEKKEKEISYLQVMIDLESGKAARFPRL